MLKKKRKRSREHKKNSQVIDLQEAREKRQRQREERRAEAEEQARIEQEKKKYSKRKRKQKRIQRIPYVIAFLIVFGILGYSLYDIIVLQIEKNDVMKEQNRLIEERANLQEELANINDPQYIEQQARLQLRLIMPGETLFVLPEQIKEKQKASDKTEEQDIEEKGND